jgi:hypothetical protein
MSNKSTFNKNKFLVLGVITIIVGLSCIAGSYLNEDSPEKLDELNYVEGQLDYSYSPWIYSYRYWSLRRRRRFRKRHFDLYLVDDHVRYTGGTTVLSNLYEEPFYNLVHDYPRPNAIIGYLDTDDPFVKDVYSIEIDGLQLVDIEGIKEDMQKEKLILIIAGIVLSLLSLFFFFKHFLAILVLDTKHFYI